MSYGKESTKIQLDSGYSWLINGRNEDVGDDGESFNGAGKSASIQAIIFTIYGTGIEDLNADQFINFFNAKKLRTELKFTLDGNQYTIARGRKPAYLELWEGDSNITQDSMKNTQKAIDALISVPFDIFIQTIFLSPYIDPFMSLTPAKQRNMMESLLGLNVLADRAKILKDVIRKEVQDDLKLYERDMVNLANNQTKYDENIQSLVNKENQYLNDYQQKIKDLEAELDSISIPSDAIQLIEAYDELASNPDIDKQVNLLKEYEAEVDNLKRFLVEIKKGKVRLEAEYLRYENYQVEQAEGIKLTKQKLEQLPSSSELAEYLDLRNEYESNAKEFEKLGREVTTINSDIKRKTKELDKVIDEAEKLAAGKCYACNQEHYDEVKLDELTDTAEKLASELDEMDKHVSDNETKQEVLSKKIDKAREDIKAIESDVPTIKDYSTSSLDNERKLLNEALHKQDTNPHELIISDLEIEFGGLPDIDIKIGEVEEKISGVEAKLVAVDGKLTKYEETLEDAFEELPIKTRVEVDALVGSKKRIERDLKVAKEESNPYTDIREEALANHEKNEKDITELSTIIDDKSNELTHINYLIKMLTDPKSFIRKNIIDQYLPFLNKKLNEYSDKLGLLHVASINSDMTIDVEYMGRNVSYFTMSRGERLRLNTSTSLAFRDLMSVMGRSFNVMMIDELLDSSSDVSGMRRIFDMVSSYAEDTFIISHGEVFKDQVDKHMVAVKRNGFTDIELS